MKLVFDSSDREIDTEDFVSYDWSSSEFGDVQKALPMNAPESRGVGFCMTAYVDADHAGDVVTRESRTGFIVFSITLQYIGCQRNSRV